MKYMNAAAVLPDALVRELQQYVQAAYLYIPVREQEHKAWGELSGYRRELQKRNEKIALEYEEGASVQELAGRYHLSIYAIRKIIYQK